MDDRRCSYGHPVPQGNKFCGTCGEPIGESQGRDSRTSRQLRRRRVVLAATAGAVLIGILVVLVVRPNEPGPTATPAAVSEDEEAEQALLQACRTAFAVPIRLEPSTLIPKMAPPSGDKAWFFDVYAKDTDAWLAKATWQIHNGRTTFKCSGAS